MSRRWTPEEDAYLTRAYGRAHPNTMSKRLNRTPKAIQMRALKLALGDRVPHGYSLLIWAHTRPAGKHWGASQSIIKAAKRDGVLRQATHLRGRPYIAPTKWIDAWIDHRYTAPVDTQLEEILATWVRTRTLATWLGIPPAHAANRLLHTRGWLQRNTRTCRRYHALTLPGQPLYWHPTDAKNLVERYHRRNECQPTTQSTSTSPHPKARTARAPASANGAPTAKPPSSTRSPNSRRTPSNASATSSAASSPASPSA